MRPAVLVGKRLPAKARPGAVVETVRLRPLAPAPLTIRLVKHQRVRVPR